MRILARILVPFNFSFETNKTISFSIDGEKAFFICQNCEGVKVYSYVTQDYENLKTNDKKCLYFRSSQKFKQRDSLPTRTIIINQESENYLEGSIDLLKSTLFDIYFAFPASNLKNDKNSQIEVKKKAYDILRLIINSYRAVTFEPDIHNPSDIDVPAIEIAYSNEDWKNDNEILGGQYMFLMRNISWLLDAATGYVKNRISTDLFTKFLGYLNSNEPVPYHLQLLADAKQQAIVHKNYNLSIVFSSTATDFYLKDRLMGECVLRKITHLSVGKGKYSITKEYTDAIIEGSLRDEIIGDICGFLSDCNILDSNEYRNWLKDAYKIRNSIIHKGLIIDDEKIAQRAFEVVVTFVNFVNSQLLKAKK